MQKTGMDEQLAKKWLQFNGFKIEAALDMFSEIADQCNYTKALAIADIFFKDKKFFKKERFEKGGY